MSEPNASMPTSRPLAFALVALGLAAGGAALLIGGWSGGSWGPRTVPLLAAATLALAGVAVARAPSAATPPPAVEGEPVAGTAPAGERSVLLLLGLAVLYVLLIDRIGYLAATALAAPAAFWLFGARRPLTLLLAATIVPFALHVAFFRLLGVFPPYGRWFDMLDVVPL